MLAVQARHKNILDADAATTAFKTDGAVAIAKIKAAYSPDQWGAESSKQLSALAGKMTADPQYAHISDYLSGHIPQLQQQLVGDATVAGIHQNAIAQNDQTKDMVSRAASEFANTDDPQQQAAIRAGIQGKVQAMWSNNPNAVASHMADFEDAAVVGTAQRLARDNPVKLDSYLQAHAGAFTPQQAASLKNAGLSSITYGYRLAGAQHDADVTTKESEIAQARASNDPKWAAMLEDAAKHNLVRGSFYEGNTGHPFRPEIISAPGAFDSFLNQIKNAKNGEEVEAIRDAVGNASRPEVGTLGGKDAAVLMGTAARFSAELKTTEGQAKQRAWTLIHDEAFPLVKNTMPGMSMFTPKIDETSYHNHFEDEWVKNKGDFAKTKAAMDALRHAANKGTDDWTKTSLSESLKAIKGGAATPTP